MFDYDDDERPTPRRRWYQQDLARHPDCRDPDHPGCELCDPEEVCDENERANLDGVKECAAAIRALKEQV